jgi:hypothetical protein
LVCTSSPSSMSMILRFGLLIESLSSCIFLSQILSCLTNISSVFSLISILSQALRFCLPLVLVFWVFCVFCLTNGTFYFQVFCLILFLRFSMSLFNSSFI